MTVNHATVNFVRQQHDIPQRGLLLLGCGEASIRVCPPLCINKAPLEVGLDVFDEAVATVAG